MAFEEAGIDIIEALSAPNITYAVDGMRFIGNPLRDDFTSLSISIQNLYVQNAIGNFLEFIVFVFCTLLFGIYSSYIAVYDYKFKTFKFKRVKNSHIEMFLGKLLSIVIVMVSTILFSALVVGIGSIAVRNFLVTQVPIGDFAINIFNYERGLIIQFSLSFLVILFYIALGFSIAVIFKNMILSTILLLVYGLLLPILGAYDFRNIISYFSHQTFAFTGRFVMFHPSVINPYVGILFLVLTFVSLLALSMGILMKRSSYD